MKRPESRRSIPRQKHDANEHEWVPGNPLTLEQIKGLDGDGCLDLIEERHGLLAETLFTAHHSDEPQVVTGQKWDEHYLPMIALMRLEGIHMRRIADFFSYEFSLLHRADEFVSENNVRDIMEGRFSRQLKQKIARYREQRAQGMDLLLGNEALFRGIMEKTGLEIADLFPEKKGVSVAHADATFTRLEIVKAFAMRLENMPYEDILARLGKDPTHELADRLGGRVQRVFSEKARRFLPHQTSRRSPDL